ncbi:hypothetical protein AJ80_01357 [Polytolypa hystricis UAMH7299]|uniref:Major facilitator superfamily (MFS) profile domain-containing protein n=1 Tax=Polytolypa hystricis (strain UAMH7299) TaxID=1447883 RepID=A0A2B7Z155_POLH7|nr:hypothetical protein AJ80_01357 [Polytolypa hystricis UAMH7299]
MELQRIQTPCPAAAGTSSRPQSIVEPPSGKGSISATITQPLGTDSTSQTISHDDGGEQQPPLTAASVPERWNQSRRNVLRFLSTNYSFIILGVNDAAYGALIPYLETYYQVSYTVISLIFLSPLVGYVTSALTNNMIHMRFGQRGAAILGPSAHLLAYIVIAVHPPYPVLVVAFIAAGFGNGIADAAWNAWIGAMVNANELLGFLHGFYGLGAMLSPLIATTLITKANWQWFEFYYLVVGAAFLELVFMAASFWNATGAEYRETHQRTAAVGDGRQLAPEGQKDVKKIERFFTKLIGRGRTAEAIRSKVTWLCSVFLIAYVGIEVALGGWIVTFMINIRHGSPFASGMVSTGFWAGITVGRVILGFVTPRLFRSEKQAVAAYLIASVALELLFWLVPQFHVSAVMVSLLGFFLGPMFPAAIVVATKLLPKHIHVSAIGFAAALGASGACILPFAVGAIAQVKGVWVMQPIVLAILVVAFGIWLCLPSLSKKKH